MLKYVTMLKRVNMKHLSQESREHKMSSHGHILVETTTFAYSITKDYVWILSRYPELINLAIDQCLHIINERSNFGF